MVCNLDQNPLKRPILGAWLPALLKAGTMWLLRAPVSGATTDVDPSERWLLDIVAWYIGWHPPNIIDTSSRPQPHLINMITLTKVSLEDMGHRIQACRVAPFLQTTHWLWNKLRNIYIVWGCHSGLFLVLGLRFQSSPTSLRLRWGSVWPEMLLDIWGRTETTLTTEIKSLNFDSSNF